MKCLKACRWPAIALILGILFAAPLNVRANDQENRVKTATMEASNLVMMLQKTLLRTKERTLQVEGLPEMSRKTMLSDLDDVEAILQRTQGYLTTGKHE